ncbi:hypothetical protein ACS0TY_003415 [Phlomoides rotata]
MRYSIIFERDLSLRCRDGEAKKIYKAGYSSLLYEFLSSPPQRWWMNYIECSIPFGGDMNLGILLVSIRVKVAWVLETFISLMLICWANLDGYFPRSDFFNSSLGNSPRFTWMSIHEAKDLVQ